MTIEHEARAEAFKRYDSDRIIDENTGEEVSHDDWGYAETERQAFIAGVEWAAGRLSVPPSDDEREALAEIVARAIRAGRYSGRMVATPQPPEWHNPVDLRDGRRAVDAILASDVWLSRRQGPVTDKQEAVAYGTALCEKKGGRVIDILDTTLVHDREEAERIVASRNERERDLNLSHEWVVVEIGVPQ